MILSRLFGADSAARRVYLAVVEQARQPGFYLGCGVPDSLDGRFEMIALHAFLVLHRLKQEAEPAARKLARDLSEAMFADMDCSLREMGAGDLGVGRRVQAMAEGVYGRVAAYEAGIAESGRRGEDSILARAVRRNVYGTLAVGGPASGQLIALCDYMRRAAAALADCPWAQLADAQLPWPDAPIM